MKTYAMVMTMLALFLFGIYVMVTKTPEEPVVSSTPVEQQETVLFFDDFDSFDETKWSHCFPGNNCTHDDNNELQFYQPENVTFEDGIATFTAKKEAKNGYPYTSGLIQTDDKFAFKYGYVEVRAKTPKGAGLWSTAWLLAEDNQWPPELNVLEQIGQINETNFVGIHTNRS